MFQAHVTAAIRWLVCWIAGEGGLMMLRRREVAAPGLLLAAPARANGPGLVTLRPGAGASATVPGILDIEANPGRLRELDAARPPRALGDVAAAAVNLNDALNAGLDPEAALAVEGKDTPCGLVWTARARDRDDPRIARLIAIHRSPEVGRSVLDRFGGTIVPAW